MKNTIQKLLLILLTALVVQTTSAVEVVTYYHNDALGSLIAATDANGKLLWKEDYQPYGNRIRKQNTDSNQQWYTGKHHEANIGLNYFGARWYDPTLGRFMAVDPVGFKETNIHSHNRYAYANNNPYLFVDPDGRESAEALLEQLRNNGGHLPSTNKLGDAANMLGNDVMPAAGEMLGDPSNLIPGGLVAGTLIKSGKIVKGLEKFADPKFAGQLERQLTKDGPKSVQKSLRTLEKRLAQHKEKLPDLKLKSSVEREIRTFKKQIDTAKQFIKDKGIK